MNRSSKSQLEMFKRDGFLKVPNLISPETIDVLKFHFWEAIKLNFGVDDKNSETWLSNLHNPTRDYRAWRLNGTKSIMRELKELNHFSLVENQIVEYIDKVFGVDCWFPIEQWYSLLSFPGGEKNWSIPNKSWHNDEPITMDDPMPWSIFVFVFLDKVEKQTGPTLAVKGSHELGRDLVKKHGIIDANSIKAFEDINKDLQIDYRKTKLLPVGQLLPLLVKTDPWFKMLVSDKTEGKETLYSNDNKDSPQIVEFNGNVGDIILFDPRCLHSYSANTSGLPRQILRIDFRRQSI